MIGRESTRVMSCPGSIIVVGDPGLASWASERLAELERRWSRFLPTSEVSALNAAAGEPRRVSPETVRLIDSLIQAWHVTDGAFDPTMLGALVGLGYAASRDDVMCRTGLAPDVGGRGDPTGVLVDPDAGVVRLPRGTAIDPGGLGKGLAADIVVEEVMARGARGVLVEVGGDLRVCGEPLHGDAWTVAVTGPERLPVAQVRLAAGGVATSSTAFRRWARRPAGPSDTHHLLDPVTLRPCDGPVVSCTVVSGTAAWSEAFTKPAFVLGTDAALAMYERHGLAALILTEDGGRRTSAAWHDLVWDPGAARRRESIGAIPATGAPT